MVNIILMLTLFFSISRNVIGIALLGKLIYPKFIGCYRLEAFP